MSCKYKYNNQWYSEKEIQSIIKSRYSLDKILTELQVPKEQKQIILDKNLENNKPDVILPIGTSGSGKSTFIKTLPQENLVVIEPDAMRVEFTGDMNNKSKDKEIYIEAASRAIQVIKQGKQVVFDTTNLTKEKRLPFIEAIKKVVPDANIQYKLMELNPELAKQRIKADIAAGKNRANVPDSTIDRHAESYKQMLIDIQNEPINEFKDNLREEIITSLLADNSFTVEINTAKESYKSDYGDPNEPFLITEDFVLNMGFGEVGKWGIEFFINENPDIKIFDTKEEAFNAYEKDISKVNSKFYQNLTVPGGTNGSYIEANIETPLIIPSIKGHSQFSTDTSIGWYRMDEKQQYQEKDIENLIEIMKKSGILEVNCN